MRKGLSPAQASALAGISVSMARKNTNAFYRIRGHWRVKEVDHVPRQMVIYEDFGKDFWKEIVEVSDSRTASQIGEYHNNVKQYANTYSSKWLRKLLRRKTIRDSNGKRHRLETRPLAILALKAMEPRPEQFEVYIW
jgi:hypothetical protein